MALDCTKCKDSTAIVSGYVPGQKRVSEMASANESYKRILTANLQRANECLRFADATNVALIALG